MVINLNADISSFVPENDFEGNDKVILSEDLHL